MSSSPPSRARVWTILILILAVAASLRIARISSGSLTFDEQWHLELSTGRGSPHVRLSEDTFIPDAPAVTSLDGAPPWYKVWTNMDFVVHPPLYCTLLRLWRDLFGQGDIAARAFSILCSLVGIGLMFWVGLKLHGTIPAAWAGLLFAVAPTQVFFAQQVRGYDLLYALSMAALCLVVSLEQRPPTETDNRWWTVAGLAGCFLGMMLTHYFALPACVVIAIYCMLRLRGRALRDFFIASCGAAGVFAIVWLPFMWKQRSYVSGTADPWLISTSPNHTIETLGRLATASWRLLINYSGDTLWPLLSGVVLLAPLFMLRRRPSLLVWCLWLAGTLGFLTVLDLTRSTMHLRHLRYISLAAPAVFMLAAVLAFQGPRWLGHIVCAILFVTSLVYWREAYVPEEPVDWSGYGQLVEQHVKPGETLLFYPGLSPRWHIEIFYLGAAHYSHAFPRPIVKLTKPASEQLVQELPGQTAWLICGPLRADYSRVPASLAPEPMVQELLPGATVIDAQQYIAPNLAILTHVRLPERPNTGTDAYLHGSGSAGATATAP